MEGCSVASVHQVLQHYKGQGQGIIIRLGALYNISWSTCKLTKYPTMTKNIIILNIIYCILYGSMY